MNRPSSDNLFGDVMKRKSLAWTFSVLCAFAIGAACNPARAEQFPNKPIRLMVGASPGGSTDITARLVGQQMSKILGQPIVIENKAGASGTISVATTSRSPADGYTLVWAGNSALTMAPVLYRNPGYDIRQMEPIGTATQSFFILFVTPHLKVNSFKEFVDYARLNPDRLNYASNGVNGSMHLIAERLQAAAGFRATHVPYKGGNEPAQALVSGQVQFMLDPPAPQKLGMTQSGQLKALAVSSPTRMKDLPNVPTFAELGYRNLTSETFFGLLAPPSTPEAVITILSTALRRSLADAGLRDELSRTGNDAVASTPAEFKRKLALETEQIKQLADRLNLKPE